MTAVATDDPNKAVRKARKRYEPQPGTGASKAANWSHDRIHLNLPGHAIIAEAYLDALGVTSTMQP